LAAFSFPGGRIRDGILGKIADLAEKYAAPGQDAIRLTNKQNLLILNIPEKNLADLKKEMDDLGLDYRPNNFRQGCVSCTGIEFCNLAVAETKNRMIALTDELTRMNGAPTPTAAATTTSSTTTTTTMTGEPPQPPTTKDVVAALRQAADAAATAAAQQSGYRAGLLGSIAASCTTAFTVALGGGQDT